MYLKKLFKQSHTKGGLRNSIRHWKMHHKQGNHVSWWVITNCNRSRSVQTFEMFKERFAVSDKTIYLSFHRLRKLYKLIQKIPHLLRHIQKLKNLNVSVRLMHCHQTEAILARLLMCDKKWLLYTNPQKIAFWLSATEAMPQKTNSKFNSRKCYCAYGGQ